MAGDRFTFIAYSDDNRGCVIKSDDQKNKKADGSGVVDGKLIIDCPVEFKKEVKGVGGMNWDELAPVLYDITKEIKQTQGLFVTRYRKYYNGSSWVNAGNGSQGSYALKANGAGTNLLTPNTHDWIAKALNVAGVEMSLKVDFSFGTDTDDNTRFGIWYQTVPMTNTNIQPVNGKWVQLPGTSSTTWRSNGWGSSHENAAGLYNRYAMNNVQITVPTKHYVYIRVYGHLHTGSGQYESVGLRSFNIHSPEWAFVSGN